MRSYREENSPNCKSWKPDPDHVVMEEMALGSRMKVGDEERQKILLGNSLTHKIKSLSFDFWR